MSTYRSLKLLNGLIFGLVILGLRPASAQPWDEEEPLPVPSGLQAHVAAAAPVGDGRELLFVFGGGRDSGLFSRNDAFDPTAEAQDPPINPWDTTTFAPLPTPRSFATETVDADGQIWVLGGSADSEVLAVVEVFDPIANAWTVKSPLGNARYGAAAATAADGRIFVFGGSDRTGGSLATVEMYDPDSQAWVPREEMPVALQQIGAELACDGLIYVMGRENLGDLTRAFNLAYDPVGNEWLPVDSKSTPPLEPGEIALGGRGMTLGPDGRIYLVNDGNDRGNDTRVFSYDPARNTWRREPDTEHGPYRPAAAALAGRIYAVGGNSRNSPEPRRVESLGPIATNSPCAPQCVDAPDGLVAWYTFDERAGDVAADHAAGHNGAHVDSPTIAEGRVGRALSFAGPGHVVVPHNPSFDFGGGDFSFDLWMRTPALGTLLRKFDPDTGRGFEFLLAPDGNSFDLQISLNGTNDLLDGCDIPNDGGWHHLAIVVDRSADEIHCFIDGYQREARPLVDSRSVNNTAPLEIGTDNSFSAGLDTLVIDELEIFDRALQPKEIQAIAGAEAAGKCKDDLHLPWDRSFCRGVDSETLSQSAMVNVDVCNASTEPRDYTLDFQYLPAGTSVLDAGCSVDGPANFTDPGPPATPIPPPMEVTVGAETCRQVTVRAARPEQMTQNGQVGCYQAIRTDVATGGTRIATGSVQATAEICHASPDHGENTWIFDDQTRTTSLRFTNTSAENLVFVYQADLFSNGGSEDVPVLQLNRQEPGAPIAGELALPAGETIEVPLEVSSIRPLPPGFQDVVISAHEVGTKEPVALGSFAIRGPLPGDAEAPVQLAGTVWQDLDGNGIQGGEGGLDGVRVLLQREGSPDVQATTTDGFGFYSSGDLSAGSYVVAIDTTTLPEDWIPTFDPDRIPDHRTTVRLNGSEIHASLDFGYRPASAGVEVFTDREAWERAVEDFVCERFEDETLPPSGSAPTPFTTAGGLRLETVRTPPEVDIQYLDPGLVDGTGELHFRDFTQGVRLTPPGSLNAFGFEYDTAIEGWTLDALGQSVSLPPQSRGFVGFVGSGPVGSFELTGGEGAQGGISLDNLCRSRARSALGGRLWNDADGDGLRGSRETGVPGAEVRLHDATGTTVAVARSDANGAYRFEPLAAGIYTVSIDLQTLPPGFELAIDPDGQADGETDVDLGAAETNLALDFGFQRPAGDLPEARFVRNCTPAAWQAEDIDWIRDQEPRNKVDDTIDTTNQATYDIVVNFRRCVADADVARLENLGPRARIEHRSKYIPSVAVANVPREAIFEQLAVRPEIAFVEQQFGFEPTLDVSLEAIRVAPGFHSPNTVREAFPALDGSGIRIAVLDTGVDDPGGPGVTHQSLPAAVASYDAVTQTFVNPDDDLGHGTHVASIALARTSLLGVGGVAPAADLIDVRVVDASSVSCAAPGQWAKIVDGLEVTYDQRSAWGVDLINISLQHCSAAGPVISDGLDAFSQLVDLAEAMGILTIAAASNNGPGNNGLPAPAAASRALTVAASDDRTTPDRADDRIAVFSSQGPRDDDGDLDPLDELKPEVTAPGWSINAARFNATSGATEKHGTSMAAPHVAGLAALIKQAWPGIPPASIKELIIRTAEPRGAPFNPSLDPVWNERWGWGLVDAFAALDTALGANAQTTDLSFPSHPSNPSWLSPDISLAVPPQVNVANEIIVQVENRGPSAATDVQILFGIHDFSASVPAFHHVGTRIVDLPVGITEVRIDWTPQGPGHRCVKVEIGYGADRVHGNNIAQRNLDIAQSPVRFQVQNTRTEEPAVVRFLPTFDPPTDDWEVTITPSTAVLGADDCPQEVEVLLQPKPGVPPGTAQQVHVEAALGRESLGGVTVLAFAEPDRCTPGANVLCLQDGRFQVEVDRVGPNGQREPGRARRLAGESGTFWFFGPDNTELAVKVLDGRAANGHWWVFYGAMTNVEYTLRVTDLESGATATYFNPAGRFFSVADLRALPDSGGATRRIEVGRDQPEGLSVAASAAAPAVTAEGASDTDGQPVALDKSLDMDLDKGTAGSCQPSSTVLCLRDGRFRVEAEWEGFQGDSGRQLADSLSDASGAFHFRDGTDVELVVKMLDGRGLNRQWWFFYATLSNVEVTLTVTDTVTGRSNTYTNPLGEFASVGDLGAFSD